MIRTSYPIAIVTIFAILMFTSMGTTNAELSYDNQLEFVNSIEEIRGHILAAEKNIELGNSEQATLHLSHPIDVLYEDISTKLKTNSKINEKLEFSLNILKNTKTDVTADFFDQQAIEIFKVLDETKLVFIPGDTQNDSVFKLNTITNLLEMSKIHYDLGIQSNDELIKKVFFDDSCAFVWRAQEILESIDDMELDLKYKIELKLIKTLQSISNNQPLVEITTQFDNIIDDIEITKNSGLGFQPATIVEIGFTGTIVSSDDNILFEESLIPSWIKLSAAWWADGFILDEEFLSAIKYLLEQEILKVSIVQSSIDSGNQEIPSWIKNRAGWWADGLVTDKEFLSGIEYMIEKGILRV
jgi:hypothetical protein